jgi:hypothetical protein
MATDLFGDPPAKPQTDLFGTPPSAKPKLVAQPPKPKWEQPKGARPSPLRTGAEYLAMPMNLAYALVSSVRGGGTYPVDPKHPWAHYGQVMPFSFHPEQARAAVQTLLQKGPQAFNEAYDPYTPGGIKTYGEDPTFGEPQRAIGGEIALQWYSPVNKPIGKVMELSGMGIMAALRNARAASPVLHDALSAYEAVGQEIARPAQRITQAASKLHARAVEAASRAAEPLTSLLSPYKAAGLEARGGKAYVTAARRGKHAIEKRVADAQNLLYKQYAGLTTAQANEIEKLSTYEDGQRVVSRDPNVPEPKKGPSLTQRADTVRQYLIRTGQHKVDLGIMEEGRLSGPHHTPESHWPRRKFGDQPVYKDRELEDAATADEFAVTPIMESKLRSPRIGGGTFKVGKVGKGAKSRGAITNPDVEALLHPDYDSAYQVMQHARESERAIGAEEMRRSLEALRPEQPVHIAYPGIAGTIPARARMPVFYARTKGVTEPRVFGFGAEGEAEMRKYIQGVARLQAKAQARMDPNVVALAEEHGIDPARLGTRTLIARSGAVAAQRLRSAAQTANRAARLSQRVQTLTGRTTLRQAARAEGLLDDLMDIEAEREEALAQAKPLLLKRMSEDAKAVAREQLAERERVLGVRRYATVQAKESEARRAAVQTARDMTRVQARATGYSEREAKLFGDAQARYQKELAEAETAQAFRKAYKRYYAEVYGKVSQSIANESALAPKGYTLETKLGLSSPSARAMALDDSFARFMTPQQTNVNEIESAGKFWRHMQVLNRLSKLSVVLLPWVHGINNLGMHYMAEGGDIETLTRIMAGKHTPDPALVARAEKAAATAPGGPQYFGLGEGGAHATTATSEKAQRLAGRLGPLGKLVQKPLEGVMHVANAQNKMNAWLFNEAEHGIAVDLFDRFTKAGMSDAEAGLRVRKAVGRIDNLSPRELAMQLNRVFYFYPWMKTVIPFWVKKGLIDPKWWATPVRAIQVNNEQQGYDDPSKAFTMTLGHLPSGQWRRVTAPIPQRILEPLAAGARVPFEAFGGDKAGMAEDVKAALSIPLYHLNPLWSSLAQLAEVGIAGKRASPYNLIYQPGQLAGRLVSPVQKVSAIATDPVGGLLTTLAGASEYGIKTAAQVAAEKQKRQAVYGMYNEAIKTLSDAGDENAANKLRAKRAKVLQALLDNAQPAVVQALMKAPL